MRAKITSKSQATGQVRLELGDSSTAYAAWIGNAQPAAGLYVEYDASTRTASSKVAAGSSSVLVLGTAKKPSVFQTERFPSDVNYMAGAVFNGPSVQKKSSKFSTYRYSSSDRTTFFAPPRNIAPIGLTDLHATHFVCPDKPFLTSLKPWQTSPSIIGNNYILLAEPAEAIAEAISYTRAFPYEPTQHPPGDSIVETFVQHVAPDEFGFYRHKVWKVIVVAEQDSYNTKITISGRFDNAQWVEYWNYNDWALSGLSGIKQSFPTTDARNFFEYCAISKLESADATDEQRQLYISRLSFGTGYEQENSIYSEGLNWAGYEVGSKQKVQLYSQGIDNFEFIDERTFTKLHNFVPAPSATSYSASFVVPELLKGEMLQVLYVDNRATHTSQYNKFVSSGSVQWACTVS